MDILTLRSPDIEEGQRYSAGWRSCSQTALAAASLSVEAGSSTE
ncbi:MAG TPA: hypothetical protein VIZ18_08515 [Ktedonobacteraceae bacterium]